MAETTTGPSVDTIDPLTGTATTGPDVTGPVGNFWALAPEIETVSTVPDEASSISLLGAVSVCCLLIRRFFVPTQPADAMRQLSVEWLRASFIKRDNPD